MNSIDLVIPGILEKDWVEIEKKIELVKPFVRSIHIDLIDGKFAPFTTFMDPAPFKKYAGVIEFELHMMVEEPINFLKPWADAGFARFIGHIEKMSDQTEFIAEAQLLGDACLAIDSETPIEKIEAPFEDLDSILVMTVKAGESGQAFIDNNLLKVESLSKKSFIPIEVDGGISLDNIVKTRQKGASRFVATSSIFGNDPKSQYEELVKKLKEEKEVREDD